MGRAEPHRTDERAEDQVGDHDADHFAEVLRVDEQCDEQTEEAGEPRSGRSALECCAADGLTPDDVFHTLEPVPHDGRPGHVEAGVGQRVDGVLSALVPSVRRDDGRVARVEGRSARLNPWSARDAHAGRIPPIGRTRNSDGFGLRRRRLRYVWARFAGIGQDRARFAGIGQDRRRGFVRAQRTMRRRNLGIA
jgi:hypothetical protein